MNNKKKKITSPEGFYYALLLGTGLILFLALILNQVWEYQDLLRHAHDKTVTRAKRSAENVKISMEKLITTSGDGGMHLDAYTKALNSENFMRVRLIHNKSVDAQYGFEKSEQPEYPQEIESLKDGKSRNWETEDFFVNIVPLIVDQSCQKCHFTPESDFKEPAPIGHVLSLIEVKIPVSNFREIQELLQYHKAQALGMILFIALLFGIALFYASTALKKMATRNRLILENTLAGFLMLDAGGIIINCNKAFASTLEYSPSELEGQNIRKICGQRSENEIKMTLPEGEIGDEFQNVDVYQSKNGRFLDVETTVSVIRSGREKIIYSFIRDITERKRSEKEIIKAKEKAEAATRLKDKFVGLVAHDLRSPLSSMIGLLQVLANDPETTLSEKASQIIRKVTGTGKSMTGMIEELLNLGKLQTGEIRPDLKFLDMRFISMWVLNDISHLAEKKEIIIENNVAWHTRIYADPNLFKEVCHNLVSNAIKFCKNGGRITLFTPENKPSILAVADTGTGIEQERIQTLFSYEDKASSLGTDGERGSGFGLAYCQEIMKAHGGAITVESVTGKGSTFFANLPHVVPGILLVEDEPSTRMFHREMLGSLDAEIVEAENGEKALEILKTARVDLILSDIKMDKMDGIKLLESVRADKDLNKIPFIVITSNKDTNTRDEAFRLGADDFVAKPTTPEELIPRVRKHIV